MKKKMDYSESPAAEQENTTEKRRTKAGKWDLLNLLIAAGLVISACFLLALLYIEMVLIAALVTVSAILVFLYRKSKEDPGLKKAVIGLRAVSVMFLVLMFSMPILLMGFEHTKSVYGVKKYLYSGRRHYDYLPEKLPTICSDYTLVTQGQFIAQDYHASAYLAFYTDKATLASYEEMYSMNGYEPYQRKTELTFSEMYNANLEEYGVVDEKMECALLGSFGLPTHAWEKVGREYSGGYGSPKVLINDDSRYNKGILLDYESGLVLIWT